MQPLPHFRVRQATASVTIGDGQTVVIGPLSATDVSRLKDKVPVLGDIPVVGRLFRSESNTTQTNSVFIFVTPTIIDSAGNPVNAAN
jgi:general secretion pathway protein D